jgi:hypothetical protein
MCRAVCKKWELCRVAKLADLMSPYAHPTRMASPTACNEFKITHWLVMSDMTIFMNPYSAGSVCMDT